MHAGHTVRLRSAFERERRVDGARLEITLTPRLYCRPPRSRECGAREGALLLSFERPGPGVLRLGSPAAPPSWQWASPGDSRIAGIRSRVP
jgi:hypothetical protein